MADKPRRLNRRAFLSGMVMVIGGTVLAACAPAATPTATPAPAPAAPTPAPKPTEAPKPAAAAPTNTPAPAPTEAPKPTAAPTATPQVAAKPTAAGPVSLRYWQYNTDIQAVEKKLIDTYTKKTSGVNIEYQAIPWQQYWQKVNATLAGGDAPDVWNTAPTFYYEYVKRNQLVNLDDYVKRDIDTSKFFQKTMYQWRVPQQGGPSYGIPRNWVCGVLYYNLDLLGKAGVQPPTNDWTFDDLLQAAVKASKPTDNPATAQFGFNVSPDHTFFNPMVYANGGKVLDTPGGTKCVLDQYQQATDATKWLVDMVNKQKASPAPGFFQGLGDPFQTGKVALFVTGSWAAGSYRKITAFKWEMAMFPKGSAAHNIYGGPDGLVLSKVTKQADAAWAFTAWLIGPEPGLEFYDTWGGIPINKELALSEDFLKVRPGNMQVAIDSEQYMYADFNAGYNEWHTALQNELQAAILNKKTPEQAMKDATKAVQDIIDKNK